MKVIFFLVVGFFVGALSVFLAMRQVEPIAREAAPDAPIGVAARESVEPVIPNAPPPAAQNVIVVTNVIIAPAATLTQSLTNALGTTQKECDQFAAQVIQLQQELETTKQQIPQPEDASAAYVGPGIWMIPHYNSLGVTKVIIDGIVVTSGQSSPMMIRAWLREPPKEDLDLGEVTLHLFSPAPIPHYRQAFCVWPRGDHDEYMLLTFEKDGLRVDHIARKANDVRFKITRRLQRVN